MQTIETIEVSQKVTNDSVPSAHRAITYTFWGHPMEIRPGISEVVYFMYSGGRVKIGTTNDIDQRRSSFERSGPFSPATVLVMRGSIKEERALHKKFRESRLHGEWFAWSEQIQHFLAGRLCAVGRATLERAQAEFKQYCTDFLTGHVPLPKRSKVKPRPICEHGLTASEKCGHCHRDIALARLARLEAHLADPNRDPNGLDHEWISQPRKPRLVMADWINGGCK